MKCRTCKLEKAPDQFSTTQNIYKCRECKNAYMRKYKRKDSYKKKDKEWRDRNKDSLNTYYRERARKNPEIARYILIKHKYKITKEQYLRLLEDQLFRCKICDTHQDELKKKMSIDHDHLTKRVRGLLCHRCNVLLGFAKDKVDILIKAADYLVKNTDNSIV